VGGGIYLNPRLNSQRLEAEHRTLLILENSAQVSLNYLLKRERKSIKLMRKTFKKLYGAKEAVGL
jgi:hypothetical protein